MFEQFFNLTRSPFGRDIDKEKLYVTNAMAELHGRLEYVACHRQFAVVTGDVGTGKTTALRRLVGELDSNRFKVLYISDSALTPRNFYWEVLNQLGCEARFYRGDAKRQLMKELLNLSETQKKIPVIITDEAHLLSREMLEEVRFLLNFKMDSYNPMSLILAGQSELRDIMKKQIYEAIRQRIDIRYHLPPFDRQQTGEYIQKHLEYAGEAREIFAEKAVESIYKTTMGVARRINKICIACMMYAAEYQTKIIDDHMVRIVVDDEFQW